MTVVSWLVQCSTSCKLYQACVFPVSFSQEGCLMNLEAKREREDQCYTFIIVTTGNHHESTAMFTISTTINYLKIYKNTNLLC